MAGFRFDQENPERLEGVVPAAGTSSDTGGSDPLQEPSPEGDSLAGAGAAFGGLPFLPTAADREEQQDIARAVTGDPDIDTRELLGGEPLAKQPATAADPGVTITKKDVLGVGLDAAKKFGGDLAGKQAFKLGAWNLGESGGNATKGLVSAKVGALVNAAKIATAEPGAERDKAIAGTAGDVLADAASAGSKAVAGFGKVGGEALKGVAGAVLAKNKEERNEALRDGGIGAAGEAAGAAAGPLGKAAAVAGGGIIDVVSAPNRHEQALRAEKRFVDLAGVVPIVGKPIGQKIIDAKRRLFPFQGEIGLDEDKAKVSGGFGPTKLLADGSLQTGSGQIVTTDGLIIDPATGRVQ